MGIQNDVPVFHATDEDMADSFGDFIEAIDARLAGPGICKIVPPPGWTPRRQGYSKRLEFDIPQPIRQIATGSKGLYRLLLVQNKPLSLVNDFRPLATHEDNVPPANDTPQDLERRYWRSLSLRPPLYGADVEGSLFDKNLKGWNLRNLDSLLSRTLEAKQKSLPGVTTPYLYFGMWRSTFAWHTEDKDLHSVNYLHYGAPKSWYCIPPAHRARFELLLKGFLPDMFRACPEFLRHKEILISPELLRLHNIPVVKLVQYPGEFVINYPGAYHSGFNHGYNCAESTNFATSSWLPIGALARSCDCRSDSVQIQMSLFLDVASPRHRQAIMDAMSSEDESSSGDDDEDDSADESSSACEEGSEGSSAAASSSCHYDPASRHHRRSSSPGKPPRHKKGGKKVLEAVAKESPARKAAAQRLAKESRDRRHAVREAAARVRDRQLTGLRTSARLLGAAAPALSPAKPAAGHQRQAPGAAEPHCRAACHSSQGTSPRPRKRIQPQLVLPPASPEPAPAAAALDSTPAPEGGLLWASAKEPAASPPGPSGSDSQASHQDTIPAVHAVVCGAEADAGGKRRLSLTKQGRVAKNTRSSVMQLRSGPSTSPRGSKSSRASGLVKGLARSGELLARAVGSLAKT